MFEIVFETRRNGTPFNDDAVPLTSLVLESHFPTLAEAQGAIDEFRAPYDERWEEDGGAARFACNKSDPAYAVWYARPFEY